jgi:recombination protein RecA
MSTTLQNACNAINKQFGAGTVMDFESNRLPDVVLRPSGSLALDIALGGGYPEGRIVEIYGWESCGKTTLAIHAAVETQKLGKAVLYVDHENAFDTVYGEALGLSYDKSKWLFSQPTSGEDSFTIIEQFIDVPEIGLIVVDSVAAMIPNAELEGEFGESKMGLHARLMSQGMRKLVNKINRSHCTVIFINQMRMKIGCNHKENKITWRKFGS